MNGNLKHITAQDFMQNFEAVQFEDVSALHLTGIPSDQRGAWYTCMTQTNINGVELQPYDAVLFDLNTGDATAYMRSMTSEKDAGRKAFKKKSVFEPLTHGEYVTTLEMVNNGGYIMAQSVSEDTRLILYLVPLNNEVQGEIERLIKRYSGAELTQMIINYLEVYSETHHTKL